MASTSNGIGSSPGAPSGASSTGTVGAYSGSRSAASTSVVTWSLRSGGRRGGSLDVTVVALGLEPLGELLAALLGDPARDEDVHEVGLDVAQDARVVRDQQHAAVTLGREAVDALGDDPQQIGRAHV